MTNENGQVDIILQDVKFIDKLTEIVERVIDDKLADLIISGIKQDSSLMRKCVIDCIGDKAEEIINNIVGDIDFDDLAERQLNNCVDHVDFHSISQDLIRDEVSTLEISGSIEKVIRELVEDKDIDNTVENVIRDELGDVSQLLNDRIDEEINAIGLEDFAQLKMNEISQKVDNKLGLN
jgi:hypothetical protein